MEQQPIRIIVEVVSSADVRRLEERDEKILEDVKRVQERTEALNRILFEMMERLGRTG